MKKSALFGLLVMANVMGVVTIDNVAAAEAGKKSNYAQIKLGMMQPTSGFNDAGYDTGIATSIAYGRYLSNHLILEGAIDVSAANNDMKGATAITGNYSQENNLGVTALLLTMKEEFSFGRLNIYGGGGIGAYIVNLSSEIETNRMGTYKMDDSDGVFGAHLVVGANYDITESIFMGIEGTCRWTGKASIDKTAVGVPVAYNDNVNGYSIAANLGFRF